MRIITLWEPWASLAATGEKRYETRSFHTNYRGPLIIHAASAQSPQIKAAILNFSKRLWEKGVDPENMPFGKILAVVNLSAVYHTEEIASQLAPGELEVGDYRPGRFAWQISVIHRFKEQVPHRGGQGLLGVPAELNKRVTDLMLKERAK